MKYLTKNTILKRALAFNFSWFAARLDSEVFQLLDKEKDDLKQRFDKIEVFLMEFSNRPIIELQEEITNTLIELKELLCVAEDLAAKDLELYRFDLGFKYLGFPEQTTEGKYCKFEDLSAERTRKVFFVRLLTSTSILMSELRDIESFVYNYNLNSRKRFTLNEMIQACIFTVFCLVFTYALINPC